MDRPDEHQVSQDKIRLANGLWVARSDWLAWRESIEDQTWESELEDWHEAPATTH